MDLKTWPNEQLKRMLMILQRPSQTCTTRHVRADQSKTGLERTELTKAMAQLDQIFTEHKLAAQCSTSVMHLNEAKKSLAAGRSRSPYCKTEAGCLNA